MSMRRKKKMIILCFCASSVFLLIFFGAFTHMFERDFDSDFHYPYDGYIRNFIHQLRSNMTPTIQPINTYNFHFLKSCRNKCGHVQNLKLLMLVKSAPQNRNRRAAIRNSWGYERSHPDTEILTVFLIGARNSRSLQDALDQESRQFNDIIQANFMDFYYNNTLKTMMGFTWAVTYCAAAKFYLFVDDDYYVSVKNLLRFVQNPAQYIRKNKSTEQLDFNMNDHERLYGGHVRKLRPLRHFSSKWYVSLSEYPYDWYPPFVNAGAYVLSKEALIDMYYASFYTKHFRFDDVYVALLAYKCEIEPFHCDHFYFDKLRYDLKIYNSVVASHGYDDPDEMIRVWSQQRDLGHA